MNLGHATSEVSMGQPEGCGSRTSGGSLNEIEIIGSSKSLQQCKL
jgi:hypothetical protein